MPINYEATKTLIRGLVQKMKSFRGNWNQNDPTADDYIKNRTHWKETKFGVLIPETSIEFASDGQFVEDPFILEIQEGSTYEVTWNGNVYQCVAYIAEGPNSPSIGNGTIASATGGNDEPFFITVFLGTTMVFAAEPGTYTISISGGVDTWHTLDKQYLPGKLIQSGDAVGSEIFNDYDNNTASGSYSHAEGAGTVASGSYSHAEGAGTVASDLYSHAEGAGTFAIGLSSHAEGNDTVAAEYYSHAEGFGDNEYFMYITGGAGATSYTVETNYPGRFPKLINKFVSYNGRIARVISISDESPYTISLDNTLSDNAVESGRAMMILTGIASGRASHAEGYGNNALGYASHAEGQHTEAIGDMSHSEGYVTNAAGKASHAEGYDTTASGKYSHAEGYHTIASAEKSHTEGYYTIASGENSHAEGYYAAAYGRHSHAEGCYTTTYGDCSHAEGKYNIEDVRKKYAHIVGNGTSETARSNAHTIDWNGLGWFAGGLKVGGTGQDDGAAVDVALKTDILSLDTTLSVEGSAADAKAVGDIIVSKQDSITGTEGQFVVIGADGKPTVKTIPSAEGVDF